MVFAKLGSYKSAILTHTKTQPTMATAAIIGLRTGKRLLNIPRYQSDLADNFPMNDHKSLQFSQAPTKNNIVAKRLSHLRHAIKALKELVDTSSPLSNGNFDLEASLEVLVSLQKSMLEKQWELSFDQVESGKKKAITCSGISARQRRINTRRKFFDPSRAKEIHPKICPRLLETRLRGYLRGTVSDDLLAHAEVVELSNKIQFGLSLEDKRLKLKKKVGYEISDKQLASSLRISRAELHSKLVEFSLAREKLAMSNVRLVVSIAQKYDNLGAEMADLIQGGLIGLLRGIEKFDSSKGFKISTYVYWWIRQGVSRALTENSKTLRLPTHLHERLSLIRNAKARLVEKKITPSIEKLSEILNMSQQKVRNATEAVNKVISLDSEAFPSLNGLPTETFHSYITDNNLENNPWHGFEEWSLKDEVNKLLCATLGARERDIIRLYYGMGNECHTWEDISKQTRYGLSRERVRRVGLVAIEKLKQAARKRKLDAMLVKH